MKQIQSKKGMVDTFFVIIMLFVLAIFMLFAFKINSELSDTLSPVFENVSSGSSVGLTAVDNLFDNTMNFVFLAVFFVLIIGLLVTSFLTPTHPIFYILAIVLFIGLVSVSAIISNIYVDIEAVPQLADAVAEMTFAHYIMGHLPLIAVAVGVLGAIIIFSRSN